MRSVKAQRKSRASVRAPKPNAPGPDGRDARPRRARRAGQEDALQAGFSRALAEWRGVFAHGRRPVAASDRAFDSMSVHRRAVRRRLRVRRIQMRRPRASTPLVADAGFGISSVHLSGNGRTQPSR